MMAKLKEARALFEKQPRGAYDCRFIGQYEFLREVLSGVRCAGCYGDELFHLTCPSCLYHGEFDEPGECIQCPKCTWGHAT